MSDATYNKSFDNVLTAMKELQKRIDYIIDHIFVYIYQPDMEI